MLPQRLPTFLKAEFAWTAEASYQLPDEPI